MCINSSDSFLFSTSLFVRSANHKRDWFIVNYGGQQLLLGGINTLGCAGISNINLICYFFKDRGGDFSVKYQKNKKTVNFNFATCAETTLTHTHTRMDTCSRFKSSNAVDVCFRFKGSSA